MKRIGIIHFFVLIITTSIFWGLGLIDKTRFDKASLTHKPELLFCYDKAVAKDGGSVYWDSLFYRAWEGRQMLVLEENGETNITNDFQGTTWTWKYHNFLWISCIVGASLIGSLTTFTKLRHTAKI